MADETTEPTTEPQEQPERPEIDLDFSELGSPEGGEQREEKEADTPAAERTPCPVCGMPYVKGGPLFEHIVKEHPGYKEESVTIEAQREKTHKDFNILLETLLVQESVKTPDRDDLMDAIDMNFGMSEEFYTPEVLYNVSGIIDTVLQRYGFTEQKRRRIMAKFHNRMSVKIRERQAELAKQNMPINYQMPLVYRQQQQTQPPYQAPPPYPQQQNQQPPYNQQSQQPFNPYQPPQPPYPQQQDPRYQTPQPSQPPYPQQGTLTKEEIYTLINQKKVEDEKDRRLDRLEESMGELIQVLKNKPADDQKPDKLMEMAIGLVTEKLKEKPPDPPITIEALAEAVKTAVTNKPNTSQMTEYDAKVQSMQAEMDGKKVVAQFETEAAVEKAKQTRGAVEHFADAVSKGLENMGSGFGGKLANMQGENKEQEQLPAVNPVLDEQGKETGKFHFDCKCGKEVIFDEGESTATCTGCKTVYQFAPVK